MRLSVLVAAATVCLLPAMTIAEPNVPVRATGAAPLPAPALGLPSQPAAPALTTAERLAALAPGADPRVIELAVAARECAIANGDATGAGNRLAVIDYSMPSTQKRMWVFDVSDARLLYAEHVAHGQGSGENYARAFSNREGSHQTSLGLFRTAETYMGGNGYSLRMDGLDPGFNDQARTRAIVMHGAPYVDPAAAQSRGRLGRSHGCPAVRAQVAREIIDTLKGGQFVFSYYPDPDFLRSARMLACTTGGAGGSRTAAR
jgi:hypothetical protein